MRLAAVCGLATLVLTQPLTAGPRYFGYSAVECGLDDSWTKPVESSYAAEVAGFTNLNMACVDADPAVTAQRIRAIHATGAEVVLNVQPALFTMASGALRPHPDRDTLWPLVVAGIRQSGVPSADIVLYVVDEPSLHGLPMAEVSDAVAYVRRDFPAIRTLMIEALAKLGPSIPPELTYWGFFDYFHRDPATVPAYVAALRAATDRLGPMQELVVVMDAMHFPFHDQAGIAPDQMDDLARAYATLAETTPKIAALLAYSWVGGVDDPRERGVRDLPPEVLTAHRDIGAAILRGTR